MTQGQSVTNGLLQLGIFLAMFSVPCGLFILSTLIGEELRDFFASTALSGTVHFLSTLLIGYATFALSHALFDDTQYYHFGLIIEIGCALITLSWLLGINGCLYGEQAPHKRISARGLRRYR